LKSGDHLDRSQAPAIQGRPFTIEAAIVANEKAEGVIVAQGGAAQGFSLFLKEGRPHFAIRIGDLLTTIEGGKLTPGEHQLKARLEKNGTLTLEVDNRPVADPVPGKTLARMPADGLDVGRDTNAAVGPYASPFPYDGEIKSVVIELDGR
jgi:hypothetical protein